MNKSKRHIFQRIQIENILSGMPALKNAIGNSATSHCYKSKK